MHMDKTLDTLQEIKSNHKDSDIILFGSRVWGTPRNDSDLDIAIIPSDILNLSSLENETLRERILKDGTKIWYKIQ